MRRTRILLMAGGLAAIMTPVAADAAFYVALDANAQNFGIEDNLGPLFRPRDDTGALAPFQISARTRIDATAPFDVDAVGQVGTIFAMHEGLGVQDFDGSGSKEISGGGGHQDEEITMTFDAPVTATAIELGVAEFDPGNGLGDKDDMALFLNLVGGGTITLDEFDYLSAFIPSADDASRGMIDFALLDHPLLTPGSLVESMTVRETRGHLLVNALAYGQVPAPGGILLLGGLFGRARRRRNRR